jgi:uncharacterized protein (UPF0335 family)
MESAELKSIIERVERLEEEKKGIADDIKDIYVEAKSKGFDPAILKAVVKLRKVPEQERETANEMIETYLEALK